MARDLKNLLDHFNLENVCVVGHSMGALTLWQYIRDFGTERLSRLCIIDQSPKLRVVTAAPGVILSALPIVACPSCWPAYGTVLGSLGIPFLMDFEYLLPITVVALLIALVGLGWRVERRSDLAPLGLGVVASACILAGKFAFDLPAVSQAGTIFLVGAVLWNAWRRRAARRACRPAHRRPGCDGHATGPYRRLSVALAKPAWQSERMPLGQTIPALPVQDMAVAVKRYADKLGFTAGFADQEFAVLHRDDSVIHVWLAADESWKHRTLFGQRPIESGAESFLAGTASCRIQVSGSGTLDRLFEELAAAGVLHGCQRARMLNAHAPSRSARHAPQLTVTPRPPRAAAPWSAHGRTAGC